MTALLLLLACKEPAAGAGDTGVDLGEGAPELALPDLSGVDLPAAFVEAVQVARGVTTAAAWGGHVASLSRGTAACPDLYVGPIEAADMDLGEDAVTWQDYCNPGAAAFGGWVSWDGSVQVEGAVEDAAGQAVDATRSLVGDGLVATADGAAFELRGEASETVYRVQAPDYTRWTWQSLVDATVTGADAFGTADQAGWRADLYMAAAGGEAPSLELRGNAFFFQPRVAGRFDSLNAELVFGADPDCTLEPRGWIGLRDGDAYWYDLVFLPLVDGGAGDGSGYDNPGYGACDGCGTLYVRGLEATDYVVEYGEVCPDFGEGWQLSDDQVPDPADFLLTLREALALEGT